ncbi:plasmid recombination protein, partial [Salipiger sp. HF18]|uniref:plasmid recombination protein n=1 Tax=Salipiger sp. HF18 TaxID=2721557 RepID=UPI0034C622C4
KIDDDRQPRDQLRSRLPTPRRGALSKQNAPVIMAGIITFGTVAAELFGSLTVDQQDAAFRELAKAVASELDTSLESLVVHLDETTIHAHFTVRAYTDAGLSMSEAAKRGTLSRLQDLAAEVMQGYHSGIERGHRKWDRIAAGAEYPDTLHRSVRELHYDLPLEIDALRQQSAQANRELETLLDDRDMQRRELDTLIADRDEVDAGLDVAGEELQSRQLELVRIREDEKAHRAELDALKASAEKTRRHLAELDAKAVEEEKKAKRRQTYLLRLEKKEAAIAAQETELALKEATAREAEAAVAEKTRLIEAREAELAQREQRQAEQADVAQARAADLDARAGEISLREREVAAARSELVLEAEEVWAQKEELDASLAAIDHVVGEVEAAGVQVLDDGRLQVTDPAPIIAAPKPLRVRLLPNIRRLVRKMDETEKRASWVEAMMTRVQRLLGRSDLPQEVEAEASEIQRDWQV